MTWKTFFGFKGNSVRPARRAAVTETLESRTFLSADGGILTEKFLNSLPPSALRGGQGSINLRITNSGFSKAIGTANVKLLLTTDGTPAGAVATVKNVNQSLNLYVAGFTDTTFNFKYPSQLATGTYQLIATVNFHGVASQTNQPYVSTKVAPAFVDLSAFFSQAPGRLTIGQMPAQSQLSILLTNSGNRAANGQATIELFESPTPTLGVSPILLQTFSNLTISMIANGRQMLTLSQNQIPLSAQIGAQYLIAVLHTSTTAPLSEASQTITAPLSTNFVTALFTVQPGIVNLGQTVSLTLQVGNAQTTALNGKFNVNLYQSPTPSLGASATLLKTYTNLAINLAVSQIATYNLSLTVPLTAVLGRQFLIATLSPVPPLAANRSTQATAIAQVPTLFLPKASTTA